MLKLNLEPAEMYSEDVGFYEVPGGTFNLEYSLIALSKWENKYTIPLLDTMDSMTTEQLCYLIQCMCMTKELTNEQVTMPVIARVKEYLRKRNSATKLTGGGGDDSLPLTSERIYAYMVVANIPFECAKWNLQNLFLLLNAVGELRKDKPKKTLEQTRVDYAERNAILCAKYKTEG